MRKKIFFTSDWHLFHANVLVYDKRPFKDLTEMHETLVKNFNYYVPKHGITYFLGDMGFSNGVEMQKIILSLNGTKVLVRGNHDGNFNSMYDKGFDVVIDKAQICVGKHIVTMSHCPLLGVKREDTSKFKHHDGSESWHGELKHQHKFAFNDFGQYHLHGHIHSGPANNTPTKTNNQFDVGVAANNYKPVSISQIESWITSTLNKGEN